MQEIYVYIYIHLRSNSEKSARPDICSICVQRLCRAYAHTSRKCRKHIQPTDSHTYLKIHIEQMSWQAHFSPRDLPPQYMYIYIYVQILKS